MSCFISFLSPSQGRQVRRSWASGLQLTLNNYCKELRQLQFSAVWHTRHPCQLFQQRYMQGLAEVSLKSLIRWQKKKRQRTLETKNKLKEAKVLSHQRHFLSQADSSMGIHRSPWHRGRGPSLEPAQGDTEPTRK